MPTRQALILAFLMVVAAHASATAQDLAAPAGGPDAPIGKVVTVSGAVTIEHVGAVLLQANVSGSVPQAKVGDFVYQGDIVQTGTDGKLALTFTDGTAFNLTRNARMVLDRFVYDPKNTSTNSTLFNVTKGSITFVAGQIAKTGDMKIETPVGTMGIRGTTPHVEIANDGSVRFTTLVEGNKDGVAAAPRQGQRVRAAGQRQARTPTTTRMSPEQEASYNRLLNLNLKICQNC
jgi:hypothetical protein